MTTEERIMELIVERDAAQEKLVELQKAMAWNCAVCSYPMKRIESDKWECWVCMERASLDARIDILKAENDNLKQALEWLCKDYLHKYVVKAGSHYDCYRVGYPYGEPSIHLGKGHTPLEAIENAMKGMK